MTIAAGLNKEVYTGNGTADTFDFDWYVTESNQITCYKVDTDDSTTELTLTTDYTITGLNDRSGGEVVLNSPLETDYKLIILSSFVTEQQTDLRNQGRFFPETIENTFDLLVNLIKQSNEKFGRVLSKKPGEDNFDAGGARIKSIGEPVAQTDVASKGYIDTKAQGVLSDATQQADRAESEADRAEGYAVDYQQQVSEFDTFLVTADDKIESAITGGLYTPVGDFGTEFTITERREVGYDGSVYWRWNGALPHTVLATDTPSGPAWTDVTQATLAADLVNPAESGNRVARMVITAESLVDFLDVPFIDGRTYSNNGFYPGATVGGGQWKAVSGADLTQNNGGTFVSKAALQAWYDAAVAAGGVNTANLQANLNVLFTAGTGTGDGFVRAIDGPIRAEWFGVLPEDDTIDNGPAGIKFMQYCNSKGRCGEFPAGYLTFKTGGLPFPDECTVLGQGDATVFNLSIPASSYLFDLPNDYARGYELGRFKVVNAVKSTRRDFGVIRLWGTLRKGYVHDINTYDIPAAYFFDTNQYGNVTLKRVNAYNFDGSNIPIGTTCLDYRGNNMMASDIEILGTFDKCLDFSGSVFKLNGFNIGGSETAYTRSAVVISGVGIGTISSGWIEQLDPVFWANGEGDGIVVNGAKKVTTKNVNVASGAVKYKNGAQGSVGNINYGQANGGLRVSDNSKVEALKSALKFQPVQSEPCGVHLTDGNNSGIGILDFPTFNGGDELTNTNNSLVTVSNELTDFLTGNESKRITTTADFQGRKISKSVIPDQVYTVNCQVKLVSGEDVRLLNIGDTTVEAEGVNLSTSKTVGKWLLLSLTCSSPSGLLEARIINATSGEFLIDSIDIFKDVSTFDTANYI